MKYTKPTGVFLLLGIAFLFLILITACSINEIGPPGPSDRQIRLHLGSEVSTDSSNFANTAFNLIRFNINNYPGVDEANFSTYLRTTRPGTECVVELINLNNNDVITSLRSDSTLSQWLTTPNIFEELPTGQVNLGVRVSSETKGIRVVGGQSILFLSRD